jgi:hypothetical protein
MTTIPRRDFLCQALAVCGSALVAPGLAHGRQATASDRAVRSSTAYLGDRADAVRAIGEAYLRQLGRDANRESILAAARGTLESIDRARDAQCSWRAGFCRAPKRRSARSRCLPLRPDAALAIRPIRHRGAHFSSK